jgi:cell wall assembly regulator SMI1
MASKKKVATKQTAAPAKKKVATKKTAAPAKKKVATKQTAAPAKKKPAAAKKPVAAVSSNNPAGVSALWARLEGWFAKHRPDLALKLRPAAKPADIARVEKKLGVSFPDDFRASLLIHDGQENEPSLMLFPFGERLGSTAALGQCWTQDRPSYDKKDEEGRFEWLSDDKRVRQVHFHPKHIAFAGSSYWDYSRLLFDFVPGPNGTSGQVIARDDVDFEFIASSFTEVLEKLVSGLENGTIVVKKALSNKHALEYRNAKKKPISERAFYAS